MAKVLVTGGTGLVGGNLVRELVKRGEEVTALVRKSSNTVTFDDLKTVKRAFGDITDPGSVHEAAKGMDCVYHSAAMVTMWAPDFEEMRRINVEGTRNVMEASLKARVKRVVHVSTADAIGFCTPEGHGSIEKPSDETVPYQNDWLKIPYMTTKNIAQVLALSYIQKGLEVVVVNPTFMFGPWDIKPSSGQMIVQVAKGIVKGYSPGGNNFVDVQDVVEAMITAMEKGRVGELYILAHENLSYREIFTKIAGVVGVLPPAFQIPKFVAMTGGLFGSLYGHLFGWAGARPEAVNWTNAKMGFIGHYFTPAKAVRELGMKQTPVEVSIERSHRWFVDHGYIANKN